MTGSRSWADMPTVREALRQVRLEVAGGPIVVVHGACPRGADALADLLATRAPAEFRMSVERHPADWDALGKRAGFVRNQHMVDLGADVCLAFIRSGSRGASHTARVAERAGILVRRWTA
ncbi:SLOG family protein [Streptantibioticus silvisoli]|uniref:SLOG family protein n=1 Tax=Streptantibioticus silvisoli TaxID=2705255 RepID=A0ABT6W4T6_9ACTN|nr:SLOG family protein [Streptantibioticus silvisoli]MDI5965773.1 SLOG family protein [Streptantibioticus silvisoli]